MKAGGVKDREGPDPIFKVRQERVLGVEVWECKCVGRREKGEGRREKERGRSKCVILEH